MKEKLADFALAFVFLTGLSLVLYPPLSNYLNAKRQSRAIVDYEAAIAAVPADDQTELLAAAQDYNKKLSKMSCPLLDYDQVQGYEKMLAPKENGIMASLSIEKIKLNLPIYHGCSAAVLNIAAGHLQGSSLPLGGVGTHTVITAHRGQPSARLFTDLDQMEINDLFQISVLDKTLTYSVDQILLVEDNEVEPLAIVPAEDYCTLLTCAPYGINTHRLLVRGSRVVGEENSLAVEEPWATDKTDSLFRQPLIIAQTLFACLLVTLLRTRKGTLVNPRRFYNE